MPTKCRLYAKSSDERSAFYYESSNKEKLFGILHVTEQVKEKVELMLNLVFEGTRTHLFEKEEGKVYAIKIKMGTYNIRVYCLMTNFDRQRAFIMHDGTPKKKTQKNDSRTANLIERLNKAAYEREGKF